MNLAVHFMVIAVKRVKKYEYVGFQYVKVIHLFLVIYLFFGCKIGFLFKSFRGVVKDSCLVLMGELTLDAS